MPSKQPTIIVEHLDPELEEWQSLEYACIAKECASAGFLFLLSGLPSLSTISSQLSLPASNLTEQSVEKLFSIDEERRKVCLLDPKAEQDLRPEDGEAFEVFLFGGILGDDPPRGIFDAIIG
jgi:ribosome biogenesis SPOUT family RNA methylase Rps3